FIQTAPSLFTKLRQAHRVLGFFARAFGHLGAISDLLPDGKLDALQFAFARKIANYLVVFPDGARPIAGNKARRDVNQARPLHTLGERDHVLRANHVRAQSTLQSWIEGDVAG